MRAFRLIVIMLLTAVSTAAAAQQFQVRGWEILDNDPDHVNRLIDLAPEYGINHIEFTHAIIMHINAIVDNPATRELVDSASRRADELGIETFVWSHEYNTDNMVECVDPSKKAGKKFWKKRRAVYRKALEAVPSVDGVVIMFGSSHPDPWGLMCPCCGSMSHADRVRIIIEQVGAEMASLGKKLYVRTFIHTPDELEIVGEAIRTARNVEFTVMTKDVPADWQPYYPNNSLIGNVAGRPQVIEFDLGCEYWGQSMIPFQLVDYLRRRVDFWLTKGTVVGSVARVERGSSDVFGTPNEINAFAYSRMLEDPGVKDGDIWKQWVKSFYGLEPGTPESELLIKALGRTFDAGRKMYYTKGFWSLEKGSGLPKTGRVASLLDRRSTADYDPDFKYVYDDLSNPTQQTMLELWQENSEAEQLAEKSLNDVRSLKAALGDKYDQLETQLRKFRYCTSVWKHLTDTTWRFGVWKRGGAESDARIIEMNLRKLAALADEIEGDLGSGSAPGNPANIRRVIADVETEFERIGAADVDVDFPVLSEIQAGPRAGGAVVTWVSSEAGSSVVEYGVKLPVYENRAGGAAEVSVEHRVDIEGLEPGRRYIFRVVTVTEKGTRLVSGDFDFTVPAE